TSDPRDQSCTRHLFDPWKILRAPQGTLQFRNCCKAYKLLESRDTEFGKWANVTGPFPAVKPRRLMAFTVPDTTPRPRMVGSSRLEGIGQRGCLALSRERSEGPPLRG